MALSKFIKKQVTVVLCLILVLCCFGFGEGATTSTAGVTGAFTNVKKIVEEIPQINNVVPKIVVSPFNGPQQYAFPHSVYSSYFPTNFVNNQSNRYDSGVYSPFQDVSSYVYSAPTVTRYCEGNVCYEGKVVDNNNVNYSTVNKVIDGTRTYCNGNYCTRTVVPKIICEGKTCYNTENNVNDDVFCEGNVCYKSDSGINQYLRNKNNNVVCQNDVCYVTDAKNVDFDVKTYVNQIEKNEVNEKNGCCKKNNSINKNIFRNIFKTVRKNNVNNVYYKTAQKNQYANQVYRNNYYNKNGFTNGNYLKYVVPNYAINNFRKNVNAFNTNEVNKVNDYITNFNNDFFVADVNNRNKYDDVNNGDYENTNNDVCEYVDNGGNVYVARCHTGDYANRNENTHNVCEYVDNAGNVYIQSCSATRHYNDANNKNNGNRNTHYQTNYGKNFNNVNSQDNYYGVCNNACQHCTSHSTNNNLELIVNDGQVFCCNKNKECTVCCDSVKTKTCHADDADCENVQNTFNYNSNKKFTVTPVEYKHNVTPVQYKNVPYTYNLNNIVM